MGFVRDNPVEPVQEETITYSHLSWSSIVPYLLPPSITIHGIHSVQFTVPTVFFQYSVQVFFGLHLGLAPCTSYSILFFTQSLSSFRSTCSYHPNLFFCSTEIMSTNTKNLIIFLFLPNFNAHCLFLCNNDVI